MSLIVHRLEFRNFRNYDHLVLDGLGLMTILVGPNAVGKTNVVEGVQLMTAIESFRHPQIKHLVKEGYDQAMVSAVLKDDARKIDLGLLLFEGKRKYLFNGKPKQSNQLKSLCPAVMFSPDDLELVKGSNTPKREALDAVICQLSGNHQVICRDYANVVKHKNALLKEGASDDLLLSMNEMVIRCGAQLLGYRMNLLTRLRPYISERYGAIASDAETLELSYLPTWLEEGEPYGMAPDAIRENLAAALDRSFEEEKQRQRCLVGPHADKMAFLIDGRDAGVFASQGQQRSIVLTYKLAEVALIQDVLGQQPVLILDDVMSELDEQRRRMLVQFMEEDMQVFITTTNLSYFDEDTLSRADVIKLPLEG